MTDPEQITGQLTEAQPALSWRTAIDKIVEAMARALYEADDPWHKAFPWPIISPDNEGNADAYRRLTRAALAVAAPMVLEMAAEVADRIESPFDEHSQAPENCAFCDGVDVYETAIRNLKEAFNGNG